MKTTNTIEEKINKVFDNGMELIELYTNDDIDGAIKKIKCLIKSSQENLIREIIEMCEKEKKDISPHLTIGQDGWVKGYNKALEDLINKLKEI